MFYRCKCSTCLHFGKENRKTRTKLAAPEGNWRLPSSPIVERKHAISLCEFKSVLILASLCKTVQFSKVYCFGLRIAKPFVLPWQMFSPTKNNPLFQKNSNETRRICGALAALDFANSGKKNCGFLM